MRSSSFAVVFALASATPALAAAQQAPIRGFATDRLYNSAPGSAWIVMDDLSMHGELGGAMQASVQYARDPFHVPNGPNRLDVVSGQLFTNIGFAATYERFKIFVSFVSPLSSTGDSGVVHGVRYQAPSLNLGNSPDTFSDVRVGFHVRVVGESDSPFRLGMQFQLWAPSGDRADFVTDGYYHAMNRVLAAGDWGRLSYAGNLGVHSRSTVEAIPGGPHGPELLFGLSAGPHFELAPRMAFTLGPEVFGQTAFRGFFGHYTTGVEALGTARMDWGHPHHPRLRLKVGAGGGLDAQFGIPAWRTVVSVDVMDFFGR